MLMHKSTLACDFEKSIHILNVSFITRNWSTVEEKYKPFNRCLGSGVAWWSVL